MNRAAPTDDTHATRVLAGRYRLIRLVGHGGMGTVFKAENTAIGNSAHPAWATSM